MGAWVAIWYFVLGAIIIGICILVWRIIKRSTCYIFILSMDKLTHQPLANHPVRGMFYSPWHHRHYMGVVAEKAAFGLTNKADQFGEMLGRTDENGFFKYCNRSKSMYAIGIIQAGREKVLMLSHFHPPGKGYPKRPKVIWV